MNINKINKREISKQHHHSSHFCSNIFKLVSSKLVLAIKCRFFNHERPSTLNFSQTELSIAQLSKVWRRSHDSVPGILWFGLLLFSKGVNLLDAVVSRGVTVTAGRKPECLDAKRQVVLERIEDQKTMVGKLLNTFSVITGCKDKIYSIAG